MNLTGTFNANQFEPNQGMGSHPPAQKVQFTVTGTSIVEQGWRYVCCRTYLCYGNDCSAL